MKIVCTHCQASYQVDLPEIKPEGVEFKCAKCEQKFLVKPQDTEQAQASISTKETVAASTPSRKTLESTAQNEEQQPTESKPPSQQEQESPAEDNLDNLLDDLLKEDLTPESEETTLEAEENQQAEADAVPSIEGADNLDGLLDDLITGDITADSTKKLNVEAVSYTHLTLPTTPYV